MAKIKGQNLRLALESNAKFIALATSCTVHIATTLEESSTKDDTTDWSNQEVTGKSWDCSVDALVSIDTDSTGENFTSMLNLVGTKVLVTFAITNGTDNRTTSDTIATGYAIVNDISVNAPNKQNATYAAQLTGVGALTIEL